MSSYKIQGAFLSGLVALPFALFFLGALGITHGFLPKQIRALALFPTPVVFTEDSYLHDRAVKIFFAGERVQVFGQADLVASSYGWWQRWKGVTLWHFLKHSPDWPESAQRRGLQAFFCDPQTSPLPLEEIPESVELEVRRHGKPSQLLKVSTPCSIR